MLLKQILNISQPTPQTTQTLRREITSAWLRIRSRTFKNILTELKGEFVSVLKAAQRSTLQRAGKPHVFDRILHDECKTHVCYGTRTPALTLPAAHPLECGSPTTKLSPSSHGRPLLWTLPQAAPTPCEGLRWKSTRLSPLYSTSGKRKNCLLGPCFKMAFMGVDVCV